MIRNLLLLIACLVAGVTAAPAGDEKKEKATTTKTKPSVEVNGLSVRRKIEGKDAPVSNYSYTYVHLFVRVPGRRILGLDKEASKVREFKDDKGTALAPITSQRSFSIGTGTAFNKDRSGVNAAASSNTYPAKGASKVIVKGDLVLICGKDLKDTKEEVIEVKAKEEKKVGDFVFRIDAISTTVKSGTTTTSIGTRFSILADKDNIKSINVTDADGKDIGVYISNDRDTDFRTRKLITIGSFTKKVEKVKVKISYFDKTEKVTVPVNLSIDLGLR